jgi:ATP-dependent RNA helicase RhlB
VETLVIDEADRMFDMGFIADLRFMLRRLPRYDQRQSMLFSATLSWAVMELAYEHMNDPVKVEVTPEQVTAENVEHLLYHVGRHEKFPLLLGLLKHDPPERALIFVNTKREAEWLTNRLEDNGHDVKALTGDLNQRIRLKVVRSFKSGELPLLVATDVASRGLHVDGVTHVINYDVPQDPEDYVHRIGRTARAGASGKAVTLACENYVMALESIEGLIGFRLPTVHVEDELLAKPIPPSHRPRRSQGRPAQKTRHPETRSAASPDGKRRRRRRKPGGQGAHRPAPQ